MVVVRTERRIQSQAGEVVAEFHYQEHTVQDGNRIERKVIQSGRISRRENLADSLFAAILGNDDDDDDDSPFFRRAICSK